MSEVRAGQGRAGQGRQAGRDGERVGWEGVREVGREGGRDGGTCVVIFRQNKHIKMTFFESMYILSNRFNLANKTCVCEHCHMIR